MKGLLSTVLILSCSLLSPSEFDFSSYLKEKVKEFYPEAVKLRRHFHKYPELCLQEEMTARFIKEYLQKCGLEVHTGIAKTGIKAILKGNRRRPVIGIRADMDALPITEKTGFDFQSQNQGVMHACGHDAHITNVLITAKLLSQIKDKIPGTVVFVFQPCEEGTPDGSPSGASQMIEQGVLENPKIDAMLGLHVMPGYPAGAVALREGPIMANVAWVFITIKGKSSHGALPHQGTDAIYGASLAILQFQAIISRLKDPKENAVLTIGKIKGGVRPNVIADRVDMEGTVRSFSVETENKIEQGMENVLKGLEQSLGISYDFKFSRGSKFVKNDAQLTHLLTPLFKRILGEKNVFITDPLTVAEDFSAYSHKIPSFFFFLGAGEKGTLHHPQFSVEEKIFLYGPLLFSSAAIECLTDFIKNQ